MRCSRLKTKHRLALSLHQRAALFLLSIALGSGTAQADDDAKIELISRFDHIETLRASFIQRVVDENGEELQVLRGKMLVRSPSHFRWEIESPYSLTYVLHHLDLIVVDPDLHQVTYRTIDSPEEVPIVALLVHREMEVLDDFDVSTTHNAFVLEPVDQMQLFKLITVYFDNTRLDAIDVRDSQDRLTEFSFRDVEENLRLDDALFEVDVADDMEVIGEPPTSDAQPSDDSL